MQTFNDFHPAALLAYFIAVSVITMFSMNPVLLLISLIGAILGCAVCGGIGKRFGGFLIVMLMLTTIINPLFSHDGTSILFILNGNPVTLEAVFYGVAMGLMLCAVLLWFRLFSAIMTSEKLQCVLGVFSPKTALLLSMTLRYVPLFVRQTARVAQTQRAMGLTRADTVGEKLRNGCRIFSVMLTWGLENGIITANSMDARGYGTGHRTAFSRFRFRLRDAGLLLCTVTLTGILLHTMITGALFCTYYPAMELPRLTVGTIISYGAFAVLVLLPIITETEETLKWHCLRSKI